MIKPKEKRERFLGERLHLKGERCLSPKCAVVRKPYPPGVHGPKPSRPRKLSDFARQIREKQKFKLVYGLTEKGLARLFAIAEDDKMPTAQKLVELLERRLDSTIFRLGLAPSRAAARQVINHGHIAVNGTTVHTPSILVHKGDVLSFRTGSKAEARLAKDKEGLGKKDVPAWLAFDAAKMEAKVLDNPMDVEQMFDISLLVQSFSK